MGYEQQKSSMHINYVVHPKVRQHSQGCCTFIMATMSYKDHWHIDATILLGSLACEKLQ